MELFTPSQVRDKLDIPATSLRRYAIKYKQHLSEYAALPGRKRRYTAEDMTAFTQARKLLRLGHSPSEVDRLLSIVDYDPPENKDLAVIEDMPQYILDLEVTTQNNIQILREAIEELLARIEYLENRTVIDLLLKRKKKT